uniref:Uncharacterized protein n=1 Tax=Serinus canaria TaxID=9135 RepID=A0A8C9NT09_SERCA
LISKGLFISFLSSIITARSWIISHIQCRIQALPHQSAGPGEQFLIPNTPSIPAPWQWDPYPVSCPSMPCPKSLSSSPGAPLGPGRGSELSLEPSPGQHPQLSQAGSRAEKVNMFPLHVNVVGRKKS